MAVYGYTRVSTTEQASKGESLDAQRQRIVGYAMMQGWEVAEVFVEAGVSGAVPLADRPQGQRLLQAVKRGDVIVTPKLDRMFRSASDALATLEELQAERVGLVMIDLGGDVTTNGISKLVFTILSAVAENERDRIRERIREVKRHQAKKGAYLGGKRPFGYQIVAGELQADVHEMMIIRKMRGDRERGDSLRVIGARYELPAMTVGRILAREYPDRDLG